MKEFWVLGTPEPSLINPNKKYNITKYLNIGSLLFNVIELKKNNFWELYTKNRNLKPFGQPDQSLFNLLKSINLFDKNIEILLLYVLIIGKIIFLLDLED